MPKVVRKAKREEPDWAGLIRELRHTLHLNQEELGRRLHYSAMAVSRWERGEQEPSDRGYIELGSPKQLPDHMCVTAQSSIHA